MNGTTARDANASVGASWYVMKNMPKSVSTLWMSGGIATLSSPTRCASVLMRYMKSALREIRAVLEEIAPEVERDPLLELCRDVGLEHGDALYEENHTHGGDRGHEDQRGPVVTKDRCDESGGALLPERAVNEQCLRPR